MKKLSFILIIIFFLLTIINTYNIEKKTPLTFSSNNGKSLDTKNLIYSNITSPIIIESDNEFTLYGFEGNGTLDNPYLLKNLSINSSTEALISIFNTNAHFIISNCSLDGLNKIFSGILLDNVSNGQIINNTIYNTLSGISIVDSSKNGIDNNKIFSFSYIGSEFIRSNENNISKNLIIGGDFGLHFVGSHNNIIIENNISDILNTGIFLKNSFSNYIKDNTIDNGLEYGISLFERCVANYVINNSVSNSQCGIYVFFSYDNHIIRNSVYGNQIGVNIYYSCFRIIVSNNYIFNNSNYGLIIGKSGSSSSVTYCSIIWNSFIDNNLLGSSQVYCQDMIDNYENLNLFAYNYWSNWIKNDYNNDGIIEEPYKIDGSFIYDIYPLVFSNKSVIYHQIIKPEILIPSISEYEFIRINWLPAVDSFGIAVTYSLYYSNNQGKTWINMVSNTQNTVFYWNATLFEAGCYQLKVIAESEGGLIAEDITGGFPLKMDHTLSSSQILTPSNYNSYSGNITISWSPAIDNCYYPVSYNISYSNDGGGNWTLLASEINGTSFEWDTTKVANGNNYKLKIVATSSSGLISSTITDNSFTIHNDALYRFIKAIPFFEIFFSLFIVIEFLILNFLIKFIRKKQKKQ